MTDISTRYSRQTVLPGLGAEGQERLTAASVLCVGAGGLGAPALLYLAAAGVGKIGIVDFDAVEESNLQRQVLFTTDDLGKPKASRAAARLRALNPDIEITAYDDELTAENAPALFDAHDIVIDGSDNFETKYLVNDMAVKSGKPWVYGAIQGFEGQVCVFDTPENGPCYRCLFPEMPKARIRNCAEAGVIGAVAGITGATQAMQAIQLIVGGKALDPLRGRLWTVDATTMQTRVLGAPKNPACPVCAQKTEAIRVEYSSPVCGIVSEVTPAQARAMPDAIIVDVREAEEREAGYIDGARHCPLSRLSEGDMPDDLPRDRDVILYCRSGIRSVTAARILMAEGYLDVYSMAGGFEAWREDAA